LSLFRGGVMNVVPDDPWTGSPDALPCSTSIITQLPNVLRGGLRDTYVNALNEDLPEEWARYLVRLKAPPVAVESASGLSE
jgi:hypothetical protein